MTNFLLKLKRIIGINFTKKYLLSQDLSEYQKVFKSKYDFILGLGESCFASLELRKAGLQVRSYPFDWFGAVNWRLQEWPEAGGGRGLNRKIDLIVNGCQDIFNREDLVEFEACPTLPDFPNRWVRNKRTGLQCVHEFRKDKSIDEQYPEVFEKYKRRVKRMYESLENANKILIVFCTRKGEFQFSKQQIEKISKKFPRKNIKWLFLMHDDSIKDDMEITINQKRNMQIIYYRQISLKTNETNSEAIQKILSPITLKGNVDLK